MAQRLRRFKSSSLQFPPMLLMNSQFRKNGLKLLTLVILIIVAFLARNYFNNLTREVNPSLNDNNYQFLIEDTPYGEINIDKFNIEYDWRYYKGKISFVISEKDLKLIKNLTIKIPSPLNFDHVALRGYWNWSSGVEYSAIQEINESNLIILFFNSTHLTDAQVKFEVGLIGTENFIPSGVFSLYSTAARTKGEGTQTFLLHLGERYACYHPCSPNPVNALINERPHSTFHINYPYEYYQQSRLTEPKPLIQSFYLNTYDSIKDHEKEVNELFAISFLFLAISLAADLILITMEILFEPKTSTKRKAGKNGKGKKKRPQIKK